MLTKINNKLLKNAKKTCLVR